MYQWLVDTLRTYPEIAIFLTLGLGFWVGKFKVGSFSLGVVTSTLLAGVLVGQLEITISGNVKSTFFLMFLFAVGYGVGPQFFRGLKGDGLQQVFFSILMCLSILLTAVDRRQIPGLRRRRHGRAPRGRQHDLRSPRCGHGQHQPAGHHRRAEAGHAERHAGGLRGDLPVRHRGLRLDPRQSRAEDPGRRYRRGVPQVRGGDGRRRSPRTTTGLPLPRSSSCAPISSGDASWVGRTVREFEASFGTTTADGLPIRVFVERLRQDGRVIEPTPDTRIGKDAVLAIAGRREIVLSRADAIGQEVDDRELLDIELLLLDVVVTNKALAGRPAH